MHRHFSLDFSLLTNYIRLQVASVRRLVASSSDQVLLKVENFSNPINDVLLVTCKASDLVDSSSMTSALTKFR